MGILRSFIRSLMWESPTKEEREFPHKKGTVITGCTFTPTEEGAGIVITDDSAVPDTELCEHCECIMRNHPCCHCGLWLQDILPVLVTGREMRCNPIAMEYEKQYPFCTEGSDRLGYVVRHTNESIEFTWEEMPSGQGVDEFDSDEPTVEDCRKTAGWLNDREGWCHRICEPWCYYHEKLYYASRVAGRG